MSREFHAGNYPRVSTGQAPAKLPSPAGVAVLAASMIREASMPSTVVSPPAAFHDLHLPLPVMEYQRPSAFIWHRHRDPADPLFPLR